MKILLAPNSFKESLSAWEVCNALERGIRRVLRKTTIYKIPVADGGRGTVEAVVRAKGGAVFGRQVTGPLGEKIMARCGLLREGEAIIEMSSAAGLHLVPPDKRNPGITTTFGVGELIRLCIDKNCKHIMIGLGDSSTNDGGVGMARALGVSFKDRHGREVGWGGKNLKYIEYIDVAGVDERIRKVKFTILSDVKNPLCGPNGASKIFSPQKGASPQMVRELEKGLNNLARVIKKDLGVEIKDIPGAGAAGGLGGGLMAFLGADMASGVDTILRLTQLERYIKKADLVITGEGMLDRQTIYGKAPMGVAQLARKYKRPLIGIAGTLGHGNELLYRCGFVSLFSIMEKPMTLIQAMKDAETLLANTSERIMRLIMDTGPL